MDSFRVRRAPQSGVVAAAAVVFMAFTAPAAAQLHADDAALIDQIQEIRSRDGPYSLALLEPLTGLGLLYRESGDEVLALATLERARHVLRVNKGLHTLEQVALVRQLIAIEQARGNDTGVWEREQDLLRLVRRHPDDLRTVPVFREIADKRMELLAAVLDGERPPAVFLGCFYQQWPAHGGGSCDAGSKRNLVQGILADAQRFYSAAIGVMLRQDLYGSDELRALELEVLRGIDFMRSLGRSSPLPMVPGLVAAENVEPWRSRMAPVAALANLELPYPTAPSFESGADGHFVRQHAQLMDPYYRGLQSLRRLYAYDAVASSGSSLQQADAVVQIADWDLLYSHNGQAVESYEAAYAMLAEAQVPATSIERLFAPPTPVVLPAFQPNPLARDDERGATGHIDVAFEITKYGRSRAVEFLGDANATEAAKEHLESLIRSNRFRPRLTDGEFADPAQIRFRYYLYESG